MEKLLLLWLHNLLLIIINLYIINTGVAGSLSPDIKAGDIVIIDGVDQHNFDVMAFGNPKGYIDNGIEPDKPTIFYSDKKLVEKFLK